MKAESTEGRGSTFEVTVPFGMVVVSSLFERLDASFFSSGCRQQHHWHLAQGGVASACRRRSTGIADDV
jgi:hypothetical protein